MDNKDKQENNNSKQVRDISYLTDSFPKFYNVYKKVADRLNAKGITSPYGKSYTYNNVFQCAKKTRWYDENIHQELALLRREYFKKQKKIQSLEAIEA